MYSDLKEKIKSVSEELSLSQWVISGKHNITYFTGYDGTGIFFVDLDTDEELLFVSPLEYWKASEAVAGRIDVYAYGKSLTIFDRSSFDRITTQNLTETISSLIRSNNGKIGLTTQELDSSFVGRLKENFKDKIVDVSKKLAEMRMIKTQREIENIRKATEISENALKKLLETIDCSLSIGETKGKLIQELYRYGSEGEAFETIVAAGRESSFPHPFFVPQKKISGQPNLLIDFGGKWNKYVTDMTRTFLLEKNDSYLRILENIDIALHEATDNVYDGVEAFVPDYIARKRLIASGLAGFFIHSLGHGVGIEVHENPSISPFSKTILRENMVITIEPGVYLRGKIGFRLENTIVIGKKKAFSLNKLPTDYFFMSSCL